MPDEPAPDLPRNLRALAARLAAYRALAEVLAEAVGRWATDSPGGDAADDVAGDAADDVGGGERHVALRPSAAAWSQHQAWHAQLWGGRFPVVPGLDLDTATRTATGALEPLRDALARATTAGERRGALGWVLDQLGELLIAHRHGVDARLDAPTARVLDLVISDVTRDSAEVRVHPDASAESPRHDLAALGSAELDLARLIVRATSAGHRAPIPATRPTPLR